MLRFPMLVTCIKTWDSPVSSHPLRGLAQGVDGTSFTGNQRRRTSAELLRHQRLAERGGKPRSIEPWGHGGRVTPRGQWKLKIARHPQKGSPVDR